MKTNIGCRLNSLLAFALTAILVVSCATVASSWREATTLNTIDAYEKFRTEYPHSEYDSLAKDKIEGLRDERQWTLSRQLDSPQAYEEYVKKYPKGRFVHEANRELEEHYYSLTKERGTVAAYEIFLERFPTGIFASEAEAKVKEAKELHDEFERVWKIDTIEAHQEFIRRYPNSLLANSSRARLEALREVADKRREEERQIAALKNIRVVQTSEYTQNQIPLLLVNYAGLAQSTLKEAGFSITKEDSSEFDATITIRVQWPILDMGAKVSGDIVLKSKGGSVIGRENFVDRISIVLPMNPALFKPGASGSMVGVDMMNFKKTLLSIFHKGTSKSQ